MLLSELEELEDIRDELIFDDIPSIFEDEELAIELVETAMHLMDEYIILDPDIISDPEFHYILLEEIEEILCIQMEEKITTLSHIYNNYEDYYNLEGNNLNIKMIPIPMYNDPKWRKMWKTNVAPPYNFFNEGNTYDSYFLIPKNEV